MPSTTKFKIGQTRFSVIEKIQIQHLDSSSSGMFVYKADGRTAAN
jgi:hypothetical protein